MNKCVSLLAGLAAINGAIAQGPLPTDHPVVRSGQGFDACHQNEVVPAGKVNYPCNEAALHQYKCEQHDTFEEQRECICKNDWLKDNKAGCNDCKFELGLDAHLGHAFWKKVDETAYDGYCNATRVPKEKFGQYWAEIKNLHGEPPVHQKGNLPENKHVGQKAVELYWTPKTKKPDESIYGKKVAPSGTIHLPQKTILVAVTASASASASFQPPFPSNGTGASVSAEAAVSAKVVLQDLSLPCGARIEPKTNKVEWYCGQGKPLENPLLKDIDYFSLASFTRIVVVDASFCGCVANQISTGTKILINGLLGFAGFTRYELDVETKTVVVDKKADSSKPLPGAGPAGVAPGAPHYTPAKPKSPEDCVPAGKKGAAASASAEAHAAASAHGSGDAHASAEAHAAASAGGDGAAANASASAHASAAAGAAGAHADAHANAHVTTKKVQGVEVWVPTANVKKEAAAAGPKASLPANKDAAAAEKPEGAKGSDSSASDSSPAGSKGSSPAGDSPSGSKGASPAGSKGESAGRPVGTGFVAPQSTGAPGSPAVGFSGAATLSAPALLAAAALMVAAF